MTSVLFERTLMKTSNLYSRIVRLSIAPVLVVFLSCQETSNVLAPYGGGDRPLASLSIQDSTFTPKINWVGGYVSVLGINRGSSAVLDTTLAWIIRSPGNNLRYPITVGQVPAGAQDLTATFGSQPISRLTEDQLYTFWVMNDEAWNQVSSQQNKEFVVDSAAATPVRVLSDTVLLAASHFTRLTDTIDIFVNIKSVDPRGRLGTISVIETDSSNNPRIQFVITQIPDSAVAAVGLVVGFSTYNVNSVVWEVLSEDTTGGTPLYRTKNVIRPPFMMGQLLAGTKAFTPYPAEGLQRNRLYYFWMATKDWDGVSRSRTANQYAWVTFETW